MVSTRRGLRPWASRCLHCDPGSRFVRLRVPRHVVHWRRDPGAHSRVRTRHTRRALLAR